VGKTLYRSHDDSRRNAAWRISQIISQAGDLSSAAFRNAIFNSRMVCRESFARINSLSFRGPQIKRKYASCVLLLT